MIVVTDTSVVLNLCWLREERLLSAIYEQVLAPEAVRFEFERKAASDPRFSGLHFPSFILVVAPAFIPPVLAANPDLDPGETAALALALERGIADVLIDEIYGRAIAHSLGLRVSGLLGVLIEARHIPFLGYKYSAFCHKQQQLHLDWLKIGIAYYTILCNSLALHQLK